MPDLKKWLPFHGLERKRLLKKLTQQSLTVKLAGAMCLVFCLVVGLGTLTVMGITKKAIAETSITSALYQTHLLRIKLLETMQDEDRDHGEIKTLLQQIGPEEKSGKVNIYNSEGIVRFSSVPQNIGQKIRIASPESGRFTSDNSFTEFTSLDRRGSLRIVHPIHGASRCAVCHHNEKGDLLGGLELFVPLEPIYKRFALNQFAYVLAALAIIALVTFLIRGLVHMIVRHPIQKLQKVMERAESGELNVRTWIHEDPDLRGLAKSFNSMVRGIQFAQRRIAQQHQRELAQANRLASLGQLISNVSHEIKNPLASISSTLHALRNEFQAINGQEIFNDLNLQTGRIEQTVNQLLRFARQAPPKFEKCAVTDPVHQAYHFAEHHFRNKRIRFQMEPPSPTPFVYADAGQLQQVFLNLFLNSAHAMPEGGIITIRIRTGLPRFPPKNNLKNLEEWLQIEVEDTGTGIPTEVLPKIFEPFFTTRKNGTGLGLPVVKGIIETHGGHIRAESIYGKGTTIFIELPAFQEKNMLILETSLNIHSE